MSLARSSVYRYHLNQIKVPIACCFKKLSSKSSRNARKISFVKGEEKSIRLLMKHLHSNEKLL